MKLFTLVSTALVMALAAGAAAQEAAPSPDGNKTDAMTPEVAKDGNATTAPETSDAIMPTGNVTDDALNVTTGSRSPRDRAIAGEKSAQVQGLESPST